MFLTLVLGTAVVHELAAASDFAFPVTSDVRGLVEHDHVLSPQSREFGSRPHGLRDASA